MRLRRWKPARIGFSPLSISNSPFHVWSPIHFSQEYFSRLSLELGANSNLRSTQKLRYVGSREQAAVTTQIQVSALAGLPPDNLQISSRGPASKVYLSLPFVAFPERSCLWSRSTSSMLLSSPSLFLQTLLLACFIGFAFSKRESSTHHSSVKLTRLQQSMELPLSRSPFLLRRRTIPKPSR
jgi:hypothetical protein